jgi:hypothetical protein
MWYPVMQNPLLRSFTARTQDVKPKRPGTRKQKKKAEAEEAFSVVENLS